MYIFAKKVFRFTNPERRPTTEDLTKVLGGGKLAQDAFFVSEINKTQEAPDWIKKDPMWDWAERDGDIMEVLINSPAPVPVAPVIKPKLDASQLQRMNKAELLQHAYEKHELTIDPASTRPDIIAQILDAQNAPVS